METFCVFDSLSPIRRERLLRLLLKHCLTSFQCACTSGAHHHISHNTLLWIQIH